MFDGFVEFDLEVSATTTAFILEPDDLGEKSDVVVESLMEIPTPVAG